MLDNFVFSHNSYLLKHFPAPTRNKEIFSQKLAVRFLRWKLCQKTLGMGRSDLVDQLYLPRVNQNWSVSVHTFSSIVHPTLSTHLDRTRRYLFWSLKKVCPQIRKDPDQLDDRGLLSANLIKSDYAGGASGVIDCGTCSIT